MLSLCLHVFAVSVSSSNYCLISLYRAEQLQQAPNLLFTLTPTPQRVHTEQMNSFFHDIKEMSEKIFRTMRELTSDYFSNKVVRLRKTILVFSCFLTRKATSFFFLLQFPLWGCLAHLILNRKYLVAWLLWLEPAPLNTSEQAPGDCCCTSPLPLENCTSSLNTFLDLCSVICITFTGL